MIDVNYSLPDLVQYGSTAFQPHTPALGQCDATRIPVQKLDAQTMLHLRHGFRDCRLRESKLLGDCSHAAGLGECLQHLKISQFQPARLPEVVSRHKFTHSKLLLPDNK